jgi:N6-adenosine-specific RNA methylase IME4
MDLAAIKALPVAALAHPDGCALALWATAPMLPQAIEVMAAWGFTYKTMSACTMPPPSYGAASTTWFW